MSRDKYYACAAHGFIFHASIDDKSSINVRVYRLSRNSLNSREIVNHDSDSLHLQLKSDREAHIVYFESCVEPDTGLTLPVLVISFKGGSARAKSPSDAGDGVKTSPSCFYYFAIRYEPDVLHTKEILPLRYYQVQGKMGDEVKFLKNMLLIWLQDKLIHIAVSSPHNKTILCDNAFQIGKHLKNITKEQLIWAGKPEGICEDCCVVLCRVTVTQETVSDDLFLEHDVSEQKLFLSVLLTEKLDGQWCKQVLCVADIIPEMYSANLLTLSVITCKLKNDDALSTIPNKVGDVCQTNIETHAIALIENGYFLELKCGQIQRCFQLDKPYFQSNFSFEIVGLLGTNSLEQFAVINMHTSDGTECLAVDMQNKKVSHHWTNTGCVLTGDFIRRGKQQLLILFSDWSFESCCGSWLLTDFGGTHIDTRESTDTSVTSVDTDSSSSVETVIKALADCLQKSKISLQEEEKDLCMKKQFVYSAWNRLHHRSMGSNDTGCSDLTVPMVTLVDGGKESNTTRSSELSPRIQIDLKQVWQFVVGEKWVVGVTAVNQSKRPLSDCVISLVSKSCQQTRQTSHWPVTSGDKDAASTVDTSLHATAKRLKVDVSALPPTSCDRKIVHHGESATAACCMNVPAVTSEKQILFGVLFHCCEVQESNALDSACGDVISVCCGEVVFNVQDYTEGKYTIDLKKTKLSAEKWDFAYMAMECVQLSVFVKVCSTFSLLGNLKSLLTEQAGFTYHKELQSFICCDREVLNLVRIQIHSVKSSKEVILRVSARDESQILLLVHYLYSCLPDDITILPSTESRTQTIIQKALSCTAEEIDWAVSGAQELLHEDHEICTAESSDRSQNTGVDGLSKVQDEFKEQQNKSQLSKGRVSQEKFNEFCRQLQVLEFKTDQSFSYVQKL